MAENLNENVYVSNDSVTTDDSNANLVDNTGNNILEMPQNCLHCDRVVCHEQCQLVSSFPEDVKKDFIEILKTGQVRKSSLTNENIFIYLEVSSMSPALKLACEDKLLEDIHLNNCLDILEIAQKHALSRLKQKATAHLIENFSDLWVCERFQHLHEDVLETICCKEVIANHCDIFRAMVKWLELNHETRFSIYCRLLELVQKLRNSDSNTSNRTFTLYHAILMMSITNTKPTIATAVLNHHGEVVCHRHLFKSAEIKGTFSVACVQKDENEAPYVYITSGKHVLRYDPIINKHSVCDHLVYPRTEGSLVAFGDYLYAIGGHHNGNKVRAIEEYDTKHQRNIFLIKTSWKVVASLPENISLVSAPCVVCGDKIFIIGQSESKNEVSTAVVIFDPSSKSIDIRGVYPNPCSECKAVAHGSHIYIASCEGNLIKYDTENNVFEHCSNLPNKGRHFGMLIDGSKIFIIGGTSFENDISRLERDEFDIQTKTWKRIRDVHYNLPVYGNCDIKVPADTSVIPFFDSPFKEIKS